MRFIDRFTAVITVGGLAAISARASAQSVYVDLDISFGGSQVGQGVPSDSFSGAAGVQGRWNSAPCVSGGPVDLVDIAGNPTNAVLTWTGSGGGLGYNNPANTGDYDYLLNDAEQVGAGGLTFTISNLRSGSYEVIVYAVEPQGDRWETDITVSGTTSSGPQAVTGPMPGNALILGITHCISDVQVDGGPLTIFAAENWPRSYVNGFQILAVPEPPALPICFACMSALLIRRRRV